MRATIGKALVGVLALAMVVGVAWAQSTPQLINYQGRLANAAGQPLADGTTVDLSFAFYGVETGGTAYLTVLQEDVVVSGGIYNVLIGSGTVTPGTEPNLAAVFQKHQDVWMGVKLEADAEMTPRARIASVPYAMSVDMRLMGDFFVKADWDGDGYLKTGNTVDCNDGDVLIHPGVSENCADGYDNDCDGDVDANDLECAAVPPGMALIPGGCFNMGDAFGEGSSSELPVHYVCISDFFMDLHEVTNAGYKACVDAAICTAPALLSSPTRPSYYGNPTYENYPVINVNWDQATTYCAWAEKRLPTEAEWEYAARGGLSGARFAWGDTATACVNANYNGCLGDTSEAGSFPANGYGLFDMGGNVNEWINDWYGDAYYSTSPINDPPGPVFSISRSVRDANWENPDILLRVAYRYYDFPTGYNSGRGFRCAGD